MAKKKATKTEKPNAKKRKAPILLIVESPAKAKTIKKYLGKDYDVIATVGHVIDLPKSKIGVNEESGKFEPQWQTIKGKGAVLKRIKKAADDADKVYLATDLDREGEAIAWHVQSYLKKDDLDRIVFNEVTKHALEKAIEAPRKINVDLVDAQFARRVLDRLVGYKVSELLWKKIWYGLSAGRVQSVALRLIVEREESRDAFIPEEYWVVKAGLTETNGKYTLETMLTKIDGKKLDNKKHKIGSETEVRQLEEDVKDGAFILSKFKTRKKHNRAFPPLTTSTMQQSANTIYGYTAKRTMGVAQALYQNGYITYMRTDSVALSDDAIKSIRQTIEDKYGNEYLPQKPNFFKNKSKNAQEAHEAIRPTDMKNSPGLMKDVLTAEELKLYTLIYNRALASQMADQEVEVVSADFDVEGASGSRYVFHAGGEQEIFDGFRKVLGTGRKDENILPSGMAEGDEARLDELKYEQKFTTPPARFTEASLVKELEKLGIGRPSTYASIISTLFARAYIEKVEKALKPRDIGRVVIKLLKMSFSRLVDYEYTAGVEDSLDKIAQGKKQYADFIGGEYTPLMQEIAEAEKDVKKEDLVTFGESDEKCDKCGKKMVIKLGRYGKFLSCPDFPKCKGIKALEEDTESMDFEHHYLKQDKCPDCGGRMVLKNSKYGKFWGCENYPECKHTTGLLLQEKCPECGKPLVEKKGRWGKTFIGCSGYPDCRYIKKTKKSKSK